MAQEKTAPQTREEAAASMEKYHASKIDPHLMAELDGFWVTVAATEPEPADMAIVSIQESSRFYPGSPPLALRERLCRLNRLGAGREADVAEAFGGALAATFEAYRGKSEDIERNATAWAGQSDPSRWRESAGLCFDHMPDYPEHRHWGALWVFYDCSLFLPARPEDGEDGEKPAARAEPTDGQRALCLDASRMASGLALAALERQWGLPAPLLMHESAETRYHWAETHQPECMDPETMVPALAALAAFREAIQVGEAAREAPSGRRKPGL